MTVSVSSPVRFCLAAALLCTAALGCGAGRQVQKGVNHYNAQNFPGALVVWQTLEQDEGAMNEKGLVRYLVYRGLTHHSLGHQQWARHFLARGRQAYQAGEPGWLPPAVVQQLEQALAGLGQAPQPAAPAGEEPITIQ